LRLPAGIAVRWTLATIVGIFLIAVPVRVVLFESWSLNGLVPEVWTLLLLRGLGIGLSQFLVFPKSYRKAWYWIPANAAAVVAADLLIFLFVTMEGLTHYEHQLLLPFAAGALFGCVTAIPLGAILRPKDAAPAQPAMES
jgi:hypothetical protein